MSHVCVAVQVSVVVRSLATVVVTAPHSFGKSATVTGTVFNTLVVMVIGIPNIVVSTVLTMGAIVVVAVQSNSVTVVANNVSKLSISLLLFRLPDKDVSLGQDVTGQSLMVGVT